MARAGVWMSRQVLFVLAWLGSAISCLMMRQMEFDADRYEARMVGSNAFAKSTMRLRQLGFANFMAMHDLQRFYDESRLADNLSKRIVSNVPRITPEIRQALRDHQRDQKTGLFDTHPADPERIKSARMTTGEALACLDCGLRIKAADFRLKTTRRRELQETHERARDGVQHLAASLMEFESNASVRLTKALQLLNASAVASRLENAEEVCTEARRLVPEALFVSGLMSELGPTQILYRRVAALFGQIEKNKQNRRLIEKIIDQMQKMHNRLNAVQQQMKDRDYPFNTEKMMLTLVQYAVPIVPDADDLFGLVTVTQNLYEKIAGLQVRLFARLAHTAEQVETILGLPPLPQPDFDKPKKADD